MAGKRGSYKIIINDSKEIRYSHPLTCVQCHFTPEYPIVAEHMVWYVDDIPDVMFKDVYCSEDCKIKAHMYLLK